MLAIRTILILCACPAVGFAGPIASLRVDPPELTLVGPEARHGLLVTGTRTDGSIVDLTRVAKFESTQPTIARLNGHVVRPVGDGTTAIRIVAEGLSANVSVRVDEFGRRREFHFENDIEPVFGRFGCNSAGCHGKAEGQNGFKLSVFGSDPVADYSALVKEGRGRRVFAASAEQSLFLRKAAGQVPHGGGSRLAVGSEGYETVRGWIAAGLPIGRSNAPTVERIRVEPSERLLAMHDAQQLRVIATYTDSRSIDVTHTARFQTNNEGVAGVSSDGLARAGDVPGEAAIMATFANEVAVFRAIVPRAEVVAFPTRPANNSIDTLVDAKLRKLNVAPSGPVEEVEFLRRAYLDVIGTLPTSAEVRAYLADNSPTKRTRLIDDLLKRPEYADLWALKWSDVLRVDRQILGPQRAHAYYRWIRESIEKNRPFDEFARDLVTADGPLDEAPAGAFYRVVPKPGEAANTLSQVFLGVRIACAECHHHPADRWTQTDYYGMAAYFTPISVCKVGASEAVVALGESKATHLRTGEPVSATPLGGKAGSAIGDRRPELAKWLTAPDNPYFARNLANRIWAHFLGRGLIDPVDDVRSTNPPSNPELLDALAKHLVESKFDVKGLIRLICASRVYQTSSAPNATNSRDQQNYSRALFKRPDAEVLMDMVTQVTGVPEKFEGFAEGTRAMQLWDSKVRHYFLKQFGRPSRTSSCECERVGEPNIAQVLHLLNGEFVDSRLRLDGGTIARWVRTIPDDAKLIDELWLTFLSRPPTAAEVKQVLAHVAKNGKNRREAFEDVGWAMLNTKEFLFNH